MRHLIFALMIALLPLRGWVGDAMATQMAVHALQSASASSLAITAADELATDAQSMQGSAAVADATASLAAQLAGGMSVDCMSHDSNALESHGASTGPGCENCSACQACHTVALSPPGHERHAIALPGMRPASGITPFVSAQAAAGQKPPIS